MSNERGFLEHARFEPGYRPVDERLRDFNAVERTATEAEVREQAARCMDCGIPFCHGFGCPLGNEIPEFNTSAREGRWKEAFDLLLSTDPFPEFTGRICPAPCEASCVLGINDDPVTICQVELSIIEKAFEKGYVVPQPPSHRSGKRAAIVGSGPAGLSVADVLNRAGWSVTVYEHSPKPGGILRYGIPNFKLEKWVVDRRIALMEEEGIAFETGVEVGSDLSHRYLVDRYDAIVLTGGAREPRDMAAPGRELEGIHFAMDYLVQQNLRSDGEETDASRAILTEGKHVVVIGGGDTGSDCVGTALRRRAKSVTQLEIMPEPPPTRSPTTPWPMWPTMRRDTSSHQEGGERRWLVSTETFFGSGRHVAQLQCCQVEWRPGKGGEPLPEKVAGSEFTLDAELVLLSIGFIGPGPNPLVEHLDLHLDQRGFIKRDENGMSSERGVFVAGDMSLGASLVVRAMADGLAVARGVLRVMG